MPTEVSGVEYSPTDFTDAHRFLGCVLPPNLCTSVQSVGVFVGGYGILPYPRRPLPILPQISQMPTEVSGVEYSPTDFTDAHRFLGCVLPPNLCTSVQSVGVFVGGYGILPYPRRPLPILPQISQMPTEVSGVEYSPTDFTDAHRFLGCVLPPNLCTSVQSVGVFVGGYGILPYPRHPLKSSHRIRRTHRNDCGRILLCWCSWDSCTPW